MNLKNPVSAREIWQWGYICRYPYTGNRLEHLFSFPYKRKKRKDPIGFVYVYAFYAGSVPSSLFCKKQIFPFSGCEGFVMIVIHILAADILDFLIQAVLSDHAHVVFRSNTGKFLKIFYKMRLISAFDTSVISISLRQPRYSRDF